MIHPKFLDCVNSANFFANKLEEYFYLEGWGKRRFELIAGTSRVQEVPQQPSIATRDKWINALKIASYCLGGVFLLLGKALYRNLNQFQITIGAKDPTLAIRCKASIDLEFQKDAVILGEDESWNKAKAPYLYDTLTSEKGTPQAGDYLVAIELYDEENADYNATKLLIKDRPFLLPGSLVREMKEDDTIRLTYKGQATLEITLKNKDWGYEFSDQIKDLENRLYYDRGGLSSQPIKGTPDVRKLKRYPHPERAPQEQKIVSLNAAMLKVLQTAKKQEHYMFDATSKRFKKVEKIDAPKPADIDTMQGTYPNFALPGKTESVSISILDDKLFLYQKRNTLADVEGGKVISNTRKDHMVALIARPSSFDINKVRIAKNKLHLA